MAIMTYWPGCTLAQDPDGVRWAVWRQRTAWRPRSPDLFARLADEAGTHDLAPRSWGESSSDRFERHLLEGAVLLLLGGVALVLEAVLLAVLSPPRLLLARATRRPVAVQLYRGARWSRTEVVPRARVGERIRELQSEIASGSLDRPREVYRAHRPWLTAPAPRP